MNIDQVQVNIDQALAKALAPLATTDGLRLCGREEARATITAALGRMDPAAVRVAFAGLAGADIDIATLAAIIEDKAALADISVNKVVTNCTKVWKISTTKRAFPGIAANGVSLLTEASLRAHVGFVNGKAQGWNACY